MQMRPGNDESTPALVKSLSKKMSLGEVQALQAQVRSKHKGLERDDVDETLSQMRSMKFRRVLARIPGMTAFMSLPTLPTSVVPASLDFGFTRARHRVHLMLKEPDSKTGVVAFILVMLAIIASIGSFSLSTMTEYRIRAATGIQGRAEVAFDIVEQLCVAVFTAEYLGRLLTVTAAPSNNELAFVERHGWQAYGDRPCPLGWPTSLRDTWYMAKASLLKVLLFIIAPLNLIDAIAIAPFYYNLAFPSDVSGNLMIIRVLRLARVFRLARMSNRLEGVQILANTIYAARDALGFLTFFLVLAIIMFGTVIFFCEGGDYDPVTGQFMRLNFLHSNLEPSPFKSIPHSFWWTIVTMTTVGYGDFYPTSNAGRVLGSVIMLCGVMVLALPITVVGSAFTEEYAKYKEKRLLALIEEDERERQELAEDALEAAKDAQLAEEGAGSVATTAGEKGVEKEDETGTVSSGDDPTAQSKRSANEDSAPPQHSSPQQRAQMGGRVDQSVVQVAPASPHTKPRSATSAASNKKAKLGVSIIAKLRGISAAGNFHPAEGDSASRRPSLRDSQSKELELLRAMQGGRARLEAVKAMEAAYKTGTMPVTADSVLNSRIGVGGVDSAALIGEVADALSQQMKEQHKDAVEASAASLSEIRELNAIVKAQAQSILELKELVGVVLQSLAVQNGGGVQLPGSVGAPDSSAAFMQDLARQRRGL